MPIFDTSVHTYEEPVQNRLGDFGVSYPVGKVIWIAAVDNAVKEVFSIKDPTDIDLAKVGSGDFGKAIYRRGKVYSITDAENFILAQAGYTTVVGTVMEPGDDLQAIVDAGSPGDTYLMRGGRYLQQEIRPQAGDTYIAAAGETPIMDGENTERFAFKAPAGNPAGVTIDGIEITDYASGDKSAAVACGTGGTWTIQNCNIHHNLNIGIATFGDGFQILNNLLNYNGQMGLKMQMGTGSTCQGNEIGYNNPDLLWPPGDEAGGTKFISMDTFLIKDNWVHHNLDNGLWCDYENMDVIYEENTIEYNGGQGIFHEISHAAIIRNNTIRYNLKRGIKITSSFNVEVHGNTIIALDATDGVEAIDSSRGSGTAGDWRVTGLNVHDNTIHMGTGYTGVRDNFGTLVVWGAPANNVFQGNDYFTSDATPFLWEDNELITWIAWQAAGHDSTGSITP